MHRIRCAPPLSLDDDVLAAARVLARQALATPTQPAASPAQTQRNGLPLLPLQPGGAPVDLVLVNQLRDEAPLATLPPQARP